MVIRCFHVADCVWREEKKSHRCRSALKGLREIDGVTLKCELKILMMFDMKTWSQSLAVKLPDLRSDFCSSPITECVGDSGAWFKTKTSQVLSQEGRQTHRTEHPAASHSYNNQLICPHTGPLWSASSRAVPCRVVGLFCFVWSRVKKAHMLKKSPKTWKEVQQWLNEHLDFFFWSNQMNMMPWLFVCDPNTTYWFINGSKLNSNRGNKYNCGKKKKILWAINQYNWSIPQWFIHLMLELLAFKTHFPACTLFW